MSHEPHRRRRRSRSGEGRMLMLDWLMDMATSNQFKGIAWIDKKTSKKLKNPWQTKSSRAKQNCASAENLNLSALTNPCLESPTFYQHTRLSLEDPIFSTLVSSCLENPDYPRIAHLDQETRQATNTMPSPWFFQSTNQHGVITSFSQPRETTEMDAQPAAFSSTNFKVILNGYPRKAMLLPTVNLSTTTQSDSLNAPLNNHDEISSTNNATTLKNGHRNSQSKPKIIIMHRPEKTPYKNTRSRSVYLSDASLSGISCETTSEKRWTNQPAEIRFQTPDGGICGPGSRRSSLVEGCAFPDCGQGTIEVKGIYSEKPDASIYIGSPEEAVFSVGGSASSDCGESAIKVKGIYSRKPDADICVSDSLSGSLEDAVFEECVSPEVGGGKVKVKGIYSRKPDADICVSDSLSGSLEEAVFEECVSPEVGGGKVKVEGSSCRFMKIAWKHGSKNDCCEKDYEVFKAWADYTGKARKCPDLKSYKAEQKRMKTAFRCALRTIQEIKEVKSMTFDGCKVFAICDARQKCIIREQCDTIQNEICNSDIGSSKNDTRLPTMVAAMQLEIDDNEYSDIEEINTIDSGYAASSNVIVEMNSMPISFHDLTCISSSVNLD